MKPWVEREAVARYERRRRRRREASKLHIP
jgi:hypothetical protein